MVKKRRSLVRKIPTRIYTVYVIELSRDCTKAPCSLAPLYVGQTAHDPEHRFAQHKAGGKLAATKAHRYGVKLRWDLMETAPTCSTRKDAEAAERAVAKALEKRGHRVFWG
jgi:predicted GIY-YIG superfamily endonuclease